MSHLILVVCTLFLAACGGAIPFGALLAPEKMSSVWNVRSAHELPSAMFLMEGDYIITQTVQPTGVAILEEEFKHGAGSDDVLPARTLLYAMTGTILGVYCAFPYTLDDLRAGKVTITNKQRCLVDEQSDGIFDKKFSHISPTNGLPSFLDSVVYYPEPIRDGPAYEVLDPEVVGENYMVRVLLERLNSSAQQAQFRIIHGTESSSGKVGAPISVDLSQLPQIVEVMGAKFTVSEVAGAKLRITPENAFPPQRFSVVSHVTVRAY